MRLPTRLRQRKPDSHKGDFGHIFILAGSRRYSGAALLCAKAAMRGGAGMVTLGIPAGLCSAIIRIKPDEVMLLPLPETEAGAVSGTAYKKIIDFLKRADVAVIGPGLSRDRSTRGLIRKLVKTARKPAVIDADGLNALADGRPGYRFSPGTIVTPHPGEMARLIGIPAAVIQKKRKEVAKNFACHYNSTVVLKGDKTVVAAPDGRAYVNTTGNPGMATAGSGDVLTGVIAAFLGQGLDAFDAAKYGVYLHGLAGDLAAKEKTQISLIATDIIDFLPKAIKRCS
jgi:ADP-dependent NAD(P)H-hydrate dehydratase / NAD(P)H-hydrate epimerase